MPDSTNLLVCDGCGLPASPEHVEERIRRLERATKYRPIHIGVLLVMHSPSPQEADDFYGPPQFRDFFDPFLEALEIPPATVKGGSGSAAQPTPEARLAEFQRRGYYMVYLCECGAAVGAESIESTVSRLGPTLVRRIRFNYKPKSIALLGNELAPLVEMLGAAGIGPLITTPEGAMLPFPTDADSEGTRLIRKALAAASYRESPAAGL